MTHSEFIQEAKIMTHSEFIQEVEIILQTSISDFSEGSWDNDFYNGFTPEESVEANQFSDDSFDEF